MRPHRFPRPLRPFDDQHRIGRRIEAQLLDFGRHLNAIQVDVKNWRIELLVRLDDREARARHLGLMPEGLDQSARERGLANPERPRKRDHVAGPDDLRQRRADVRGRRLVLEDHFAPRGMVRVTVVPFPFVDFERDRPAVRFDELTS